MTEVAPALSAINEQLANDMATAYETGDPRKVSAVKARNLGPLAAAIRTALQDVTVGGAESMRQELVRQTARTPLYDAQGIISSPGASLHEDWVDALLLADGAKRILSLLKARAEQILGILVAALEAIARRLGLDFLRRGRYSHAELVAALQQIAGTEARREAIGAASEAFNMGRTDVIAQAGDRIGSLIYSAILDRNTCAPCAAADGTRVDFGSPAYVALDPPNMACSSMRSGRNACRCTWVAVLK